jgi:hypothetical protein
MSKVKKGKDAIGEDALDQGSVSEELDSLEPKVEAVKRQDEKRPEIKLNETKRPVNLRADVMPSDGYVLAVDGKLKTRFNTSEEAMTAGLKLKQTYPVIQVAVFDAAARSYTPVTLPEN